MNRCWCSTDVPGDESRGCASTTTWAVRSPAAISRWRRGRGRANGRAPATSSLNQRLDNCPCLPASAPFLSMPDVHDVAVSYRVALPLQSPVAGFLRPGERSSRCDEVVVVHDLRAEELVDEVGVDDSRRFLRRHARSDRPGTALVFTHREERLQPE